MQDQYSLLQLRSPEALQYPRLDRGSLVRISQGVTLSSSAPEADPFADGCRHGDDVRGRLLDGSCVEQLDRAGHRDTAEDDVRGVDHGRGDRDTPRLEVEVHHVSAPPGEGQ